MWLCGPVLIGLASFLREKVAPIRSRPLPLLLPCRLQARAQSRAPRNWGAVGKGGLQWRRAEQQPRPRLCGSAPMAGLASASRSAVFTLREVLLETRAGRPKSDR